MMSSMAGEECHRSIVMLEDVDGCRGVAPWGKRVDSRDRDEAIKLLKPGSTDNCNVHDTCIVSTSTETRNTELTLKSGRKFCHPEVLVRICRGCKIVGSRLGR